MNRVCLIAVLAASLYGCAARQSEPVGFARQPQLKSDRPARRTKDSDKSQDEPRILPETYYAAGRVAEQQGSPDKAIEHYRKAVSFNHQYTAAYARLGLMLSVTGQHEKAVEAFSKAVELKPNSAILRNNLGFELLYVERWDEAERHLREASELDPKLAHAQINLGILLGRTGRYDQALASFQSVLPEPDAHYNLGLLHRAQGRHADAADSFRYVLSLHPEFTAAQKQLTQVERRVATNSQRPTTTTTTTTEGSTTAFRGGSVIADAPTGPTSLDAGPKQMVDLGSLINEIIPSTVVQPEQANVRSFETLPTTPVADVYAPAPSHTVKETVTITGSPITDVVPVETVIRPEPSTIPTSTTTTTIEPIRDPAPFWTTPTADIKREEIKPEPRVEPTAMIPVIRETAVATQPEIRHELPLAEAARMQRNAENPSKALNEPHTVTSDKLVAQSAGSEEVMLVLGESESMERTSEDVKPTVAPLSHDTQTALKTIDSMDASLEIIRNEVECRRETDSKETIIAPVEIVPIEPSTSDHAVQAPIGVVTEVKQAEPVPAADLPGATATESSVAFIKAVPVDTAPAEKNVEAAQGVNDVGPAYYSPPKTTPRRVRPGNRR